MTRYGYVDTGFEVADKVHKVVIGPFDSREEAERAALRNPNAGDIVEWYAAPGPDNPCPDCGSTFERLPMPPDTAKVYDALFPDVLDWREDEDCGMNALMRNVAEAAAAALRS